MLLHFGVSGGIREEIVGTALISLWDVEVMCVPMVVCLSYSKF